MPADDDALTTSIRELVDRVAARLDLSDGSALGRPAGAVRADLGRDALNLAAGVLDSDGRQSDAELRAYVEALDHVMPDLTRREVTPADLRASGIVTGKRSFLEQPSPLFAELVAHDRAHGTTVAKDYYDCAMKVAFTAVSLDDYTSTAELEAIERFRTRLLTALPVPTTAAGTASPAAAAGGAPADQAPARPLDELLAELDGLIGMAEVKREVKLISALLQVQRLRRERGLKTTASSHHLIFVGNPGTGKTTVARLLAQIYRTLGVVAKGQLIETDRSGLVAGYVGQTAPKVVDAFDRADQGVLLIDEAYSLVRGGEHDFGHEAIDAIVKLVEDRRDRVVCIMAGYPDEMGLLIDANPGLASRFPKTVTFPDYSTDELIAIFRSVADKAGYVLGPDAVDALRGWFDRQPRTKGFGNGRAARNLFEAAMARQAARVVALAAPTDDDLTILHAGDIDG